MRAILAALALSVSVAGCALPAPSGLQKYQTLRASIVPTGLSSGYGYASGYERVAFRTNRPAYVALFEITPGAGTSLLYPSPGQGRMDGFTYSGFNSIDFRRRNAETYIPTFGRGLSGPRFLFLIASERPLDIAQFGGYGFGLRSALGMRFASLNAYDSMERLAQLALPSTADDGTWTTDMYVYWPEALNSRRGNGVLIRCNGYSMMVPYEYVGSVESMLCDARRAQQPKPNNPLPGDSASAPSDSSAGPAQPGRRRPLPKAEESSFRERITSSAQLEEPRAGLRTRPGRREAWANDEPMDSRSRETVRRGRSARNAGDDGSVSRSAPRSSEPTTRSARPARPKSEPSVQRQSPPRARPAPSRPSSGASSGSSSPRSGSGATKSKASSGAIKGG